MGAKVEIMTPDHHDLVLAITSHLPHLIAYTIVGTADELAQVTSSEVIKFSAGGFRDFTRIAASDPTMWRDVFLANKDAVLEMLGTFNEDLSKLTRAIRRNDGEALFEHFTRTRAIRRGIVEIGQDSAAPDFGRPHRAAGEEGGVMHFALHVRLANPVCRRMGRAMRYPSVKRGADDGLRSLYASYESKQRRHLRRPSAGPETPRRRRSAAGRRAPSCLPAPPPCRAH